MLPRDMTLESLAQRVGEALCARGFMLAVAESCTGGWVAQTVTSVAGSSQWFDRGYVVYTNVSKQEMLGVDPAVITQHGAVSEATALAMAQGALQRSPAQLALAVTGVAGPAGGSVEKPVGTVCCAWAATGREAKSARYLFHGDRRAIREQAVAAVLEGLLRFIAA